MVAVGVLCYMMLTLIIGLWSAQKVRNSTDFLLAGKKLGISYSTAALFATWFGAETIIGASSEMAEKGILGIIEDPLGAALCLLLLGLFFAVPLYRMNLMTFGDFYRVKYDKNVELTASVALTISYFGWIAGQISALGVIFHEVLEIPQAYGAILGTSIVLIYTFFGGMWSVATLDLLQNLVIVIGLAAILWLISPELFQIRTLQTLPENYFQFFPNFHFVSWTEWLSTWMIVGLGSIPGQDIFQRVMSSKNERTAKKSAFLASAFYVLIGAMPLMIAVYIKVYHPELIDSQNMIVQFVHYHTPSWVQLLFMGALISAIMSSASGAIMAPASVISENLIPRFTGQLSDSIMLKYSRYSVLAVGLLSWLITLFHENIFRLVGMSAAISGVSLFVPLVFGFFSQKHSILGAYLAITLGLISFFSLTFWENPHFPPMFWGLIASLVGMIVGNFWKRKADSRV